MPRAQQCAVEQDGCGGRVRSHAGWYAGRPVSGNPALEHAARGASLAPWTPRHHHHAPSPAICAARLSACRDAFAHLPQLALDIALPTLCVSCREPVDGEGVCAACWAKLSFIAPPFCPRLGIPFVYDPGPELLSMEAIANPPAYQRARAAVRYDDVARTLVHSLKYQDRTDLAPAMGRWMARAGQELLAEADVLVPVPLHWRRGWSRRYNQSGALARVISRQSGVKLASEALRRIRADRAADRAVPAAARQQCPGRIQGRRRAQRRYRRPPRRPDRRCPDLGRHDGRLRPGPAARQGRAGRRAGIRAGCGQPPRLPYNSSTCRTRARHDRH